MSKINDTSDGSSHQPNGATCFIVAHSSLCNIHSTEALNKINTALEGEFDTPVPVTPSSDQPEAFPFLPR